MSLKRLVCLILLGMAVIPASRILLAQSRQAKPAADAPIEITAIRSYAHPKYTRIVIEMEKMREYVWEEQRIPDKILIDVLNARLKTGLSGKTIQPKAGIFPQAQIAPKNENTIRLTINLDFALVERYKVWHLADPFRVIVDITPREASTPAPIAGAAGAPAGKPESKLATPGGAAQPAGQQPPGGPEIKPAVKTGSDVKTEGDAGKDAKAGDAKAAEAKIAAIEIPPAKAGGVDQKISAVMNPPNVPPAAQPTPAEKKAEEKAAAPPDEKGPQPAKPASLGYSLARQLGLGVKTIVIDPGHGGSDPGCLGKQGIKEKDIALDVSLQIQNLLVTQAGMNVIMIRDSDQYVGLESRTVTGNLKKADIFISIHVNAHRNKKRSGVETFFLNLSPDPDVIATAARENAMSNKTLGHIQDAIKKILRNDKIVESRELAGQIHKNLVKYLRQKYTGIVDLGAKGGPFWVLIAADMPCALVEISHLSNAREEELLKTPAYRQQVAQGIYEGIIAYVKSLGKG